MTKDELFRYLQEVKKMSPENAWEYVNSGKSVPGLGLSQTVSNFITDLKDPNKPYLGGNFKLPDLKGLGTAIRSKPLWKGGPKFSSAANTISGIYQGGKALKGLYENTQKDSDYNSLKNDISLQIASNPMYDMYMDASDEKLLRQMRNGTLTDNWSNAASGAVQGIPQAAGAALLGGITGGVPGALIGGIGSLVNSGISGYGKGTDEANAKLQGLYSRLKQADEEYRSMKRPSGLRRAGLSSQYFNQLY